MRQRILIGFLIIILILQAGCGKVIPTLAGTSVFKSRGVEINDKGRYYEVTLDFNSGLSHREMGEEFAEGILAVVPNYEVLVDSYMAEIIFTNDLYKFMLYRVADIKNQIPPEYRDEIEGMASKFSGGNTNIKGDDKVSVDEFYLFNLVPDVFRAAQCSVVSAFGKRSATHKTVVARNLDWFGGAQNQISRIQAVINLKYPQSKVWLISYLGYMGVLSGFNDSKVFTGILDSASGAPYSSQGRRSYPMDLRFALENKKSLEEVADYMKDPAKFYAFNHIIALSDPDKTEILENNFSFNGIDILPVKRALRNANSPLNNKISWGISDAVGSVNSFLLKGNYDNHTPNKYNTKRWKNMKEQLKAKGKEVTYDELKAVASYDNGSPGTFNDSGDLYNRLTQQIIVFEPDTFRLEIFFHHKDGKFPNTPDFVKIPVNF